MINDFFTYVKDELRHYYRPVEIAAIKKRINILIDEVYFKDPEENEIIFDFTKSKDELFEINRDKAEELARKFDRSPAKIILKGNDKKILRENIKRECLIDGIAIIQNLKEILRGENQK